MLRQILKLQKLTNSFTEFDTIPLQQCSGIFLCGNADLVQNL